MSDYFKVKIEEENESSSDGEQRWADSNMGCVTSPPNPMAYKHSSCPYMAQGHADERRSAERYDIFTDGSFDKELESVAFLLDHEVKTISGAAVVLAGTGQN